MDHFQQGNLVDTTAAVLLSFPWDRSQLRGRPCRPLGLPIQQALPPLCTRVTLGSSGSGCSLQPLWSSCTLWSEWSDRAGLPGCSLRTLWSDGTGRARLTLNSPVPWRLGHQRGCRDARAAHPDNADDLADVANTGMNHVRVVVPGVRACERGVANNAKRAATIDNLIRTPFSVFFVCVGVTSGGEQITTGPPFRLILVMCVASA
jgi:hypothetical protein